MVHIGVIDSGVNREFVTSYHVNIESAAIFNVNLSKSCVEIIEYEKDDIEKWKKGFINHLSDESGHGTAVTSILFRNFPKAVFSIAKVFKSSLFSHSLCLVESLKWMIEKSQTSIINISVCTLDTEIKDELYELTLRARDKGIQIFVAASNIISFPSIFDTVTSVIDINSIKNHNISGKFDLIVNNSVIEIWHNGKWEKTKLSSSWASALGTIVLRDSGWEKTR